MKAYRKLIVAILGVVLIAIDQQFGIGLGIGAEQIMTFLIPVLVALGVWAAPNDV
jgi:uncharacterized membrane protein